MASSPVTRSRRIDVQECTYVLWLCDVHIPDEGSAAQWRSIRRRPRSGAFSRRVTRPAEITGIPYAVIELNPDIIRREKSSRRPFFIFGDAVQEEVLEYAGIRTARTLVIMVSEPEAVPRIINTARRMAPSIYIIARTQQIRHAQYLLDLGADEVVSEEYEAAKEIFTRALRKYRLPEPEIGQIVRKIEDWGYSKFIKNGNNEQTIPEMDNILLASPRMHTLTVEPGSFADGKTIMDLDLKARYGITDSSLRKSSSTHATCAATTKLQAGDALMVFTTDKTMQEIAGLFCYSVK